MVKRVAKKDDRFHLDKYISSDINTSSTHLVGGIIPSEDAAALEKSGIAAVYTPKDFELNRIMADVVRIVERANGVTNG